MSGFTFFPMVRASRFFSGLIALLAIATAGRAQIVERDAVAVAVGFLSRLYVTPATDDPAELTVGDVYYYNDSGTTSGWREPTLQINSMKPGMDYTLPITKSNVSDITLQLDPPPGYQVYIDDVRRSRAVLDGDTVKIRIESVEAVAPGEASSLRPGRIVWTVGLGTLSNGKSAGVISLRDDSIPSSPSAFTLLYDNASPEVEKIVVSGTIRQIYATSCLVNVVDDGGRRLKFYMRGSGQIGSKDSSGLYTLTGDPLFEYLIEAGTSIGGKFRITRTTRQGGSTQEMWTQMNGNDVVDWVEKPSGATSVTGPVVKHSSTEHPSGWPTSAYRELMETQDGSGNVIYAEQRSYYPQTWSANELVEIRKPHYGYATAYQSDITTMAYSDRRVSQTTPRGAGDTYSSYYTDLDRSGQIYRVFKPFKDTAANPSNASVGEVVTYDYEADWTGRKTLPKSIVTTTGGTLTAKTEIDYSSETLVDTTRSYASTANATMNLVVATKKDYYDSTHYLTTVTKTFRDDCDPEQRFYPGLAHSVKNPDGTMAVTIYFRGTFDISNRVFNASTTGAEVMKITFHGTSYTSGTGAFTSYTVGSQTQVTESDFRVMPNVSTAEVLCRSADGMTLSTQNWICTGTVSSPTWQVVQRDVIYYSDSLFLQQTWRDSGDNTTLWYAGGQFYSKGRIDYAIDTNGVRTDFTYDNVNRVATKTRQSASAISGTDISIPAVVTTFTYDAAGHVLTETTSQSSTSEVLVTSRAYDKAGRMTNETVQGVSTGYDYEFSSSTNRSSSTTLPSGEVRTETLYADGKTKTKTFYAGGVVADNYDYAIETDGRRKTSLTHVQSSRWRYSWVDLLGRPIKNSQPGFGGSGTSDDETFYDTIGRVAKTTKTGFAPTLFEYNAMSQVVRTGLDLDEGGALVLASGDRITDMSETYEYYDSAWWLTKVTSNYPFTGGSASTAKQQTKTRKRLTGLGVVPSPTGLGTLRGETRTYDAEDNETRQTVRVNTSTKIMTGITRAPGMVNDKLEQSLNGFPVLTTDYDGLTYLKRYDVLLRQSEEINPRSSSTAWLRFSYATNSTRRSDTLDATNRSLGSTTYDSAGRPILVTDAAGKTTRTSYTDSGQVEKVWGTATYPVSYVYNGFNERVKMRTYRDASNASTTDTTSFPSVGTYDETTWDFDSYTGLLSKKTDAKGKFVEYTYNARGQTYERFWSRTLPSTTTRVKATFAYFGDSTGEAKTGELKSITYNDGTPTVSYTYTRSAQTDSVTDTSGVHDFVYDSSKPWRLSAEALDTFYGSRLISRTYDSATSTSAGTLASHTLGTVLGRTAGLKLGSSSTPAAELEFSYPISNTGRVAGVVSARGNGAATRTFTYGYETNSSLLKSLAITGSHPFTITRDFETYRDLITNVEAKWSTTSRTKFGYVYDDRRQRQSVVQSGDVFDDYGGSDNGAIHQIFTYNGRGELTGAGTFLGATATDQTNPLSARKHEYDYDGIGNRRWSNTSGNSALRDDYTVNELNQYTARENNTLAVGGTVANDSNIKVAAGAGATQLAGRHGRHWGDNITLENNFAPFQGDLTLYAVNTTTGKKMTETRTAFIAPLAQTFAYDEDGNITADGVWTYEWDAENRLVAMQTTAGALAGGVLAQRFEFKYDYMNRRVEKLVRGGWNGTTFTSITKQTRFVYDGWSMIAEFSLSGSTLTLLRTYTWGLDIAKSLTHAGGVGALLQITDHEPSAPKAYLPSYDGNGNVTALFYADASSSAAACVAAYEYSPYGEFLRCEGAFAKLNPFRFSTKFIDDETGLIYYGHRYYSPSLGRFLGRDAIKERGGLNLYGFVGNNPANRWDYLGMIDGATVPYSPASGVTYNPAPDNSGMGTLLVGTLGAVTFAPVVLAGAVVVSDAGLVAAAAFPGAAVAATNYVSSAQMNLGTKPLGALLDGIAGVLQSINDLIVQYFGSDDDDNDDEEDPSDDDDDSDSNGHSKSQ